MPGTHILRRLFQCNKDRIVDTVSQLYAAVPSIGQPIVRTVFHQVGSTGSCLSGSWHTQDHRAKRIIIFLAGHPYLPGKGPFTIGLFTNGSVISNRIVSLTLAES